MSRLHTQETFLLFDLYPNILQAICKFLTPFEYVQLSFVSKHGFELFSVKGKLNLWKKVNNVRTELINQEYNFVFSLDSDLVSTHEYSHLFSYYQCENKCDKFCINGTEITITFKWELRGRDFIHKISILVNKRKIEEFLMENLNCDSAKMYYNRNYNIVYISYMQKEKFKLEYCIDLETQILLYVQKGHKTPRLQNKPSLIFNF